jgi:hypothetical protein
MITDTQLAMMSNMLGIVLFLLVVLFHFIAANSPSTGARINRIQ